MSAASCRVNFHYFVGFVGCPCMISNHDFISVIPINPPFIFVPLFIVGLPLIEIGPNICRKRTTLKIVNFSASILVQIVILDHHVPRVVNVIVHSHSWLHQAIELLKRIPILVHKAWLFMNMISNIFWVHYPVLGHCRVAELISSIAASMNFCSSGLSKISSTGT